MRSATTIEIYQGDGGDGPFGYIDGWFINWYLEAGDDRLLFWLEAEDGYEGDGPMDRTAAEDAVRDRVDRLESREYSRGLQSILSAIQDHEETS